MSTSPPPPPPPLSQQFSQPAAKRKPKVYVDVVAKGTALVTGPDWSGIGRRQGSRWRVETEHSHFVGQATSSHNVGHMLAKHHGHEPDSYELVHEVEPGAYNKWENQQAGR
jgi:hypothetical protein